MKRQTSDHLSPRRTVSDPDSLCQDSCHLDLKENTRVEKVSDSDENIIDTSDDDDIPSLYLAK